MTLTSQDSHVSDQPERPTTTPTRRTVLRGAGLAGVALPVLAACGGGTGRNVAVPGAGDVLAQVADVPVGGGVIIGDHQVVLTQPEEGQFRAFTAVCTHQGCPVNAVVDARIICPCHGSEFSVEDGANLVGPNGAKAGSVAALAAVRVEVRNGDVVRL